MEDQSVQQTENNATELFDQTKALFIKKLHQYGTADLYNVNQITARMKEKIARIEYLIKSGNDHGDESINDTFADLSGYSIIGELINSGGWINNTKPADDAKILLQRIEEVKEFPVPSPQKVGDVGFDLYTKEDTIIPCSTQKPVDVPTGIKVKLPEGYWALIINRSSTARKLGLDVVNGVIDTGYTGELYACVWNRTGEDKIIKKGDRLAQFIIFKSYTPDIVEVDKLPQTERGETGFGSSGR